MNRVRGGALLVLACFLLSAASASAQPRRELAPPTARHHADYGLLAAGATTLSIAWSAATVLALSGFSGPSNLSIGPGEAYAVALIPVVGPAVWGAMLLDDDERRAPHLAALAFVGTAAQAVGLGMLIAGLIGVDEVSPEVAEGVVVIPMASLDGAGVALALAI